MDIVMPGSIAVTGVLWLLWSNCKYWAKDSLWRVGLLLLVSLVIVALFCALVSYMAGIEPQPVYE